MMKNFFRAALVLPLLLFAVSCSESNDDGGDNDSVTLAIGTDLEQLVYADEQQGRAPIKFTATGPWAATVVPVSTKTDAVGGSQVDWLKLSVYRGGAGEVSLTMELQPNLTGQDRKAEIRIACGDMVITITVVQKATKADGTKPEDPSKPAGYALVERVEANFFVGCKESYSGGTNRYVFRYDDKNRIAEYEITEYEDYNGDEELELDYKYTTRFDYTRPDEIRLTEVRTDGSDYTETKTYRVQLDDYGRATQFKADGNDVYADSLIIFRYNDEGRLARVSWYRDNGTDDGGASELAYEEMTYQNGVFSKVVSHHDNYGDHDEFVFPADAFSDHPNDRLNIDPNWLLFTIPVEPDRMLPTLRLAGKSCDRLTLWLPNDDDDWDWVVIDRWEEPNVTVHKVHDYYEHETGRLQYTFNDDGTIATIVQPVTCIQMRYEYDIVAGNELFHPGRPDWGYKATQENRKTSEIGRSAAQHKWTFTYRQ